jgi:hypothetical protein
VDTWWYVSEGERKGPAGDDELRRLLLDGKLTPASLVWKSGLDTWCPVEKLDELAPILGPLPPEIPSSQIAAGQPRWRRHLGFTIALVFGALALIVGINAITTNSGPTGGTALLGLITILGALAYRSAKRRKLGEVGSTTFRKCLEVALLLAIVALIFAQNDVKRALAEEPIANCLAPVWAIAAYLILIIRSRQPVAGYRLGPSLAVGLEGGALGNEEYNAGRGGGFMRLDFRKVEITLSGGFTGNYLEDEPSGYVSLGVCRAF